MGPSAGLTTWQSHHQGLMERNRHTLRSRAIPMVRQAASKKLLRCREKRGGTWAGYIHRLLGRRGRTRGEGCSPVGGRLVVAGWRHMMRRRSCWRVVVGVRIRTQWILVMRWLISSSRVVHSSRRLVFLFRALRYRTKFCPLGVWVPLVGSWKRMVGLMRNQPLGAL